MQSCCGSVAVRNPDNLVQVVQIFALGLRSLGYFSYEFYRRLSDNASTLFDIAGQSETSVALDVGAGPERAYVQLVTDDFFTALGVDAVLGSVNTEWVARLISMSFPHTGSRVMAHHDSSRPPWPCPRCMMK